jgi:hypothetical protein
MKLVFHNIIAVLTKFGAFVGLKFNNIVLINKYILRYELNPPDGG